MLKNEDCLALPLLLSDGGGLYWTRETGHIRTIEYITADCAIYPVIKRNGEHWVTINLDNKGPVQVTVYHLIERPYWEVRLFRGE